MKLRYAVNDIPPRAELMSLGIAWAIVAVTFVIVLGSAVSSAYGFDTAATVGYIQKLMVMTGGAIIAQVLLGHKLPAMFGPAGILLVAALASVSSTPASFSTALFFAGVLCTLISQTELIRYLQKFFTTRVTATILMLVAITILPTILNLLFNSSQPGGFVPKLIFSLIMLLMLFLAGRFLEGLFKTTMYLWGIIIGSVWVFLLWGFEPHLSTEWTFSLFSGLPSLELSLGVLIPVFICYIALIANEIGSIHSVSEVANSPLSHNIIRRTLTLSGIINALSGLFGIIGGANYSISSGIVLDNKNASKYPILIGGILVLIIAFISPILVLLASIPSIVIGCLLLYILTLQFSAAFSILETQQSDNEESPTTGIIVGFTLLITTIISFLPVDYITDIPEILQPCVRNGFVIGMITLMILEHIIFRQKRVDAPLTGEN